MEESYKRLIDGNRRFALTKKFEDPEYFKKLSLGQKPEYLWIGCSDSRVPANEVTSTEAGQIFVHRNVANLVVHTDMSMLTVLDYAVNFLKVKHIVVCGHYGCGGINAAINNQVNGIADNWLLNIKNVYNKYSGELQEIKDPDKRMDKLTELNVIEQVRNIAKTSIVQKVWSERPLHIHGWVYGINSGLISDLCVIHDGQEDIEEIYRYNIK
ncbi:MAG: carbonic anhydrase [Bacteroidetes bacterium]|nr:carbonic anhydrase [Bacteroidota bacterium]